ncbi:transposase [Streptomyces sp. NEAU-Y11]|uniref:transposase n=1 Tax=Streptomyces cucumeris TaxID=2962890 RepID=UPI0035ABE296
MPVVGADLSRRLFRDELWERGAPLLPSFGARLQGGGTARCDERAVFTAVAQTLASGCVGPHLPPTFGTSPAAAHRRFTVWTEAGLHPPSGPTGDHGGADPSNSARTRTGSDTSDFHILSWTCVHVLWTHVQESFE